MNPTLNKRRRCRHSGPPECAPIHGPGGAGNVKTLRRRDGQLNRQGWSGVQGGRLHGGAAPGQLDCGTGGSFFFGARGGHGRAAVPPPPPRGAPRATVRREGGAAKDCGLRRDRGQEPTMSGKGSKNGNISGNNISQPHSSIIYQLYHQLGCSSCNYCYQVTKFEFPQGQYRKL